MTVHNLGSINIDLVFRVPHIPAPGETLLSSGMSRGLGGKGANTSIALAGSGAKVRHYGAVGADGEWTIAALEGKGVDCSDVRVLDMPSGQAVIQVDDQGENAITLLKGANWGFGTDTLDALFENAKAGDWLVLQNETDHVALAARRAKERGINVAYAAAPFDAEATENVIPFVDLLAMNEIESEQFSAHIGQDISELSTCMTLVTKGSQGAVLNRANLTPIFEPAKTVTDVVDTTGAGDTFFGYFLGSLANERSVEDCLKLASAAAAISVTKVGAADAIPTLSQVETFLAEIT